LHLFRPSVYPKQGFPDGHYLTSENTFQRKTIDEEADPFTLLGQKSYGESWKVLLVRWCVESGLPDASEFGDWEETIICIAK
jgi:hypothetical protein